MESNLPQKALRDSIRAELLTAIDDVEYFQCCPYTYVNVGTVYKGAYYTAIAFSKVRWPDRWNSTYGLKLAINKALAKIAKAIVAGVALEETPSFVVGHDVISMFAEES